MTREEAKEKIFYQWQDFLEHNLDYAGISEAYKMAIEALEQANEKTSWHIAHGMYEDRFWCSCGYIKIMDSSMTEWKYCPNCGAKKGGQR